MGNYKLKEKEQKIRKTQKRAKKKPKTRVKDDFVKRAKNRLKTMKRAITMVWARENKSKSREISKH